MKSITALVMLRVTCVEEMEGCRPRHIRGGLGGGCRKVVGGAI